MRSIYRSCASTVFTWFLAAFSTIHYQAEWAPQLPSSAEAFEAVDFNYQGAQDDEFDDDLLDADLPLRSAKGGQFDASCHGKRHIRYRCIIIYRMRGQPPEF